MSQYYGPVAVFKYAVFGGLSSSVILVGIALVYGMTGTLNMTHLASRLSESNLNHFAA